MQRGKTRTLDGIPVQPVHKRLTLISAAVCGGVVMWAATLAYLTYRVCLAAGGIPTDSFYSCVMPGGNELQWFALLHPLTTLLSVAMAVAAVALVVRWLSRRGGPNAV